MKTCFKCGRFLPLTEFYRHAEMGDGHLNKCKDCTKQDVKENYNAKREHYSEYERTRNQDEHRKELKLEYQRHRRYMHPEKNKARGRLNKAVRDGKVIRQPCEFCGDPKTQAHHHDYEKPLDVTWVCFKCHREKFHNQVVVSGYS